ncbi:motility protein A [Agromyces humi]|uniref:motility protein A n=1 Tax=Agromyces humi TaxID=1766800 RepID=UPI001356E0BC|nr:MotA/TolQ/ExbB proton channel family protein [Agromyces humi]
MDVALIVGILLAFGSVFAMITMEGAHVESLLLAPPMILVFGATIAVGFASGRLKDALRAFGSIPRALIGRSQKPQDIIDQLVGVADKARREGLLSLEEDANKTDDEFLKNALQNIADGTDSDELRELLDADIHSRVADMKLSAKFFKTLGGYAPTIGIIGTVVSLTHVLENLDSPETLGPSIATAFVATLWGLVSANFIWLPLGDRLGRLAQVEEENKILALEGVLAIQNGIQSRLLGERLRAMVPDHLLTKEK